VLGVLGVLGVLALHASACADDRTSALQGQGDSLYAYCVRRSGRTARRTARTHPADSPKSKNQTLSLLAQTLRILFAILLLWFKDNFLGPMYARPYPVVM
jgi:hypothetical protein